MIKVLWISNIPSPYKVELMNLLGKEVDLTACFEYHAEENRENSWYNTDFDNFKAIYLDAGIKQLYQISRSNFDLLINSDYSKLNCMILTSLFRFQGKPVILQADGGIPENRGFFMNKIISLVMKNCNYYLSSGLKTNEYFSFYGVPAKTILNYRFSSINVNDLDKNKALVAKKEDCRRELNLKESKIILSVGQIIPRKGFDILLKAIQHLETDDVGVVIAGGNPTQELIELVSSLNLTNIHFVGFKNKAELAKYYASADIFVLPTREDIWGLVINEAMSFKLPVVSTERCVAAMEFNQLFHNGIIVPIEDEISLAKGIDRLLLNEEFYSCCSENSWRGIQEYTIENTKEDYLSAIKKVVNQQ